MANLISDAVSGAVSGALKTINTFKTTLLQNPNVSQNANIFFVAGADASAAKGKATTVAKNLNSNKSGSGGSGGGTVVAAPAAPSSGATRTSSAVVYKGSDEVPITPQVCYIYDQKSGETYMFDGVLKVNHSMTLKIEEEITKDQEKYVNNAKNEPNKVTFDVIMSDVYTSRDALTNKNQTRSVSALMVLNNLKRARNLVDVITNLMTYKDMLLSGIALTQDDTTTHFGWYGQLTFQEKFEAPNAQDVKTEVSKAKGAATARTPSVWVNWIGANAI